MTLNLKIEEIKVELYPPSVIALPAHLQNHLTYAQNAFIDNQEGLVIDDLYSLEHLSLDDKIALYGEFNRIFLSASKETHPKWKILLFDLADQLLRELALNPACGAALEQELKQVVKNTADPLFAKMARFRAEGSPFKKEGLQKSESSKYLVKVLTCTVETAKSPAGGIGGVVRGLNEGVKSFSAIKNQHGLDQPLEVDSFVPLYVKDKSAEFDQCVFEGLIEHYYLGTAVRTSIYKNPTTGEYLVQPDPRFMKLFNIPVTFGVYENNKTSDCFKRSCYLGSAFAASCLQYTGKNQQPPVRVIAQADYFWGGSVAFPIFHDIAGKNPNRQVPASVLIMHHGKLEDRWPVDPFYFKQHLENFPNNTSLEYDNDLIPLAMHTADKVVFVSKTLAARAQSEDPLLSHGKHVHLNSSKTTSIRNGVRGSSLDPSNEQVFKKLALKRTYSADGKETTDFVSYRKWIKNLLFSQGILASPELDLVVHVGRFDYYKGTDIVRYALDQKLPSGAQFMVMGSGPGEASHVQRMKELAATSLKDRLRVIDGMADQSKTLIIDGEDTGVSIGSLIRAAADLYFFPSHAEACPLVGMEALCTGAPVVVPSQEDLGFALYIKPFDLKSRSNQPLVKDSNAFGYSDHTNTKLAIDTLFEAITRLQQLSTDERNQFAQRISSDALKEFSWIFSVKNEQEGITNAYGAAPTYETFYNQLIYGKDWVWPANKTLTIIPSKSIPDPSATALKNELLKYFPNSLSLQNAISYQEVEEWVCTNRDKLRNVRSLFWPNQAIALPLNLLAHFPSFPFIDRDPNDLTLSQQNMLLDMESTSAFL